MNKIHVARTCMLILFLGILLIPIARGYHVSVTWGSTYHLTGNDPDPYWWATYEQPAQSYTASYITNLVWSGQAGSNWVGNNFYGGSTTAAFVYQCSDSVQSNQNYDFLMTFHVGDMYPAIISGTRHYAYYGAQGTVDGIVDLYLYPHTGAKHRFTFIYTCANGGLIDINNDGYYDFYGYVDTQNGTGIVGMPYAWTKRTNLSWDGYAYPDYSGYVYIGFENISKWMCDNSDFIYYNYGDFVRRFYYYALVGHYQINTALNWAMLDVTFGTKNFGASTLYNGYDAYAFGQIWRSRMRVFGDGSMNLPL